MNDNRNKMQGCLVGGAVGDALGYAIEFQSESQIFSRYGSHGITSYRLREGRALISDDTQMTLFTANALLYAGTRGHLRGILGEYREYIAMGYRDWLLTQHASRRPDRDNSRCISWLMNEPDLFHPRAPGNTCLSAIAQGCWGRPDHPINTSKGCGGVMRVAPIGLYFDDPRQAARVGAEAAALTHGHDLGWLPAAMLSALICLLVHGQKPLWEAALEAKALVAECFPKARHQAQFQALMDRAIQLAREDTPDLEGIHALGEGWVGDEAMAIALFCALKHETNFAKGIIAAVNHNGDSDSTGAIAGNILGAALGLNAIPARYLNHLELLGVILELGKDLATPNPFRYDDRAETDEQKQWLTKYLYATYSTGLSD